MIKKRSTIRAADLTKKLTLDVRITGAAVWRVRIWLGSLIMVLASRIMGAGGINITTGRDERLEESNSLLRSAYQIALRGGKSTNWDAFGRRLRIELDRQFKEKQELPDQFIDNLNQATGLDL